MFRPQFVHVCVCVCLWASVCMSVVIGQNVRSSWPQFSTNCCCLFVQCCCFFFSNCQLRRTRVVGARARKRKGKIAFQLLNLLNTNKSEMKHIDFSYHFCLITYRHCLIKIKKCSETFIQKIWRFYMIDYPLHEFFPLSLDLLIKSKDEKFDF